VTGLVEHATGEPTHSFNVEPEIGVPVFDTSSVTADAT
jgi:hypothetical protein